MIRLVLFILFFLWVVRAPYVYRDSVRASVQNNNPESYIPGQNREKTQAFIFASQNYKAGDPRRTKAISDLAIVRWQQLSFEDAERLYRLVLFENKAKSGFDQSLEEAMLHLAAVLNAQQKFDQATSYYLKVLNYDKKYLSKTNFHIARDYNNLGLSAYLKALSKDRGQERTLLLKQATDFYKQALQIYHMQPRTEQNIAVVLYNEHLALRDLNDWDGARIAKAQAAAIDSRLNKAL